MGTWIKKWNSALENKEIEIILPQYLKDDIEALCLGRDENQTIVDCLWGEVYGSINMAFYDNIINAEEAAYLRDKYLGI